MNNTFCIRISYFIVAILLYLLTIKFINITLPQDSPKIVNTITNDKVSYFGFGSLVGTGISVLSYFFNIILGFSSFNGFKNNYSLISFPFSSKSFFETSSPLFITNSPSIFPFSLKC